MDEGDLGRGDRVELFDEVRGDGEGVVIVGHEVFEVLQGVEAMLERVRSGLQFAFFGAGSSGL